MRRRELHRPVRRHQAEAVPAITPGLPDAAALEHDVLDTARPQLMADGEPGLPAADDRNARLLHRNDPTTAGDGSPSRRAPTRWRRGRVLPRRPPGRRPFARPRG